MYFEVHLVHVLKSARMRRFESGKNVNDDVTEKDIDRLISKKNDNNNSNNNNDNNNYNYKVNKS